MKMASVLAAGAGARPSQLLRPSATPLIPIRHALKLSAVKAAAIDFRFKKNVLRLPIRKRWQAVSASNPNRWDGDSTQDKSTNDADAAQGPPLLTILAGFLVLLLVFWIIGSILMWLISLFVRLPPSRI